MHAARNNILFSRTNNGTRAAPCPNRPNCRPRICSANTFSTPSVTFPCPPLSSSPRFYLAAPTEAAFLSAGHCTEERVGVLTFRPGTAIIVVTRFRFFVCPRNSTSPPPSPLPIFFPTCVSVSRAVQIRLSPMRRSDTIPARNPFLSRWMRTSRMRGKRKIPAISILGGGKFRSMRAAVTTNQFRYFDRGRRRVLKFFPSIASSFRDERSIFLQFLVLCYSYSVVRAYEYFKMVQGYIHLYGYLRISMYSVGSLFVSSRTRIMQPDKR